MEEKRELEFIGIDFWSRPVFKDNRGNYFGNMDILFNGSATFEEVTEKVTEENIYYFGRDMDDDPAGIKIAPSKIVLVKKITENA
ncbi:MAG: hypothetical protein ACFFKA_00215 [Candidatus Thorarchaeota archaeon]